MTSIPQNGNKRYIGINPYYKASYAEQRHGKSEPEVEAPMHKDKHGIFIVPKPGLRKANVFFLGASSNSLGLGEWSIPIVKDGVMYAQFLTMTPESIRNLITALEYTLTQIEDDDDG